MRDEGPAEELIIGEWRVDPALDTISRGSELHKLEPRMMRLLMCLANAGGAVVSVDQLLREVWSGVVVGAPSVYQAVSQLRRLLGDTGTEATYIANVPRKGYRLVAGIGTAPGARGPEASSPKTGHPPAVLAVIPAVAALILAGVWAFKMQSTPIAGPPSGPSIVVLPFVDLTAGQSDQVFCDGLTEELSAWLSQVPTLRVVARTSAYAFRGHGEDVRKIAQALNTDHVLEGSVRRSDDRMRITVQLIDARTGYHMWSESIDRSPADTINVQEDIARSVARTLQLRLTLDAERQFTVRRANDAEAYQLYLLARSLQRQLTLESTDRAIELYHQALAADPNFAPAHVQLAYALLNQGFFHETRIDDVATRMEPQIAAALSLDDHLSSAYAVRGALRAAQMRTDEGLADLKRAIELNPNDVSAWAEIGRIALFDGRPRAALADYDRAAALDPLNFTLQEQLCTALTDLARYAEAQNACERARTLQPAGTSSATETTVWLAEARGRIDEALRWNSASLQADPADSFDLLSTRAILWLSVGLAAPARLAIERSRNAANDDPEEADMNLVRVVFREGGANALRAFLASSRLEASSRSDALFEAAYARLQLGEPRAAMDLLARALVAPNRIPGYAESPWYARGARLRGTSYRLDLAAAQLALGDRATAQRELNGLLEMLNRMIGAGVERNMTYELRAKVFALLGREDEAMRDLDKAVKLGWRRAWWAMHEPYLAPLQHRKDFQELIAQVARYTDDFKDRAAAEL